MMTEQKIEQRGRSMVEILGVLAIVGVLSIGGLWSFGYAIQKNMSNEIMAEISRRAVLISSLRSQGLPLNTEEFTAEDETLLRDKGIEISYSDNEFDGFFTITMKGVPDNVIQHLLQSPWDMPYNVYINGVQIDAYDPKTDHSLLGISLIKSAHAAEGNTIRFIFHNELDPNQKPAYIGEEKCSETGGTWNGKRCTCPNTDGKIGYMAANGCAVCDPSIAGDCSGKVAVCYRDSDCPSCSQACSNGKCVSKAEPEGYCEGNRPKNWTRRYGAKPSCTPEYIGGTECESGEICTVENGTAKCVTAPVTTIEPNRLCEVRPWDPSCTTTPEYTGRWSTDTYRTTYTSGVATDVPWQRCLSDGGTMANDGDCRWWRGNVLWTAGSNACCETMPEPETTTQGYTGRRSTDTYRTTYTSGVTTTPPVTSTDPYTSTYNPLCERRPWDPSCKKSTTTDWTMGISSATGIEPVRSGVVSGTLGMCPNYYYGSRCQHYCPNARRPWDPCLNGNSATECSCVTDNIAGTTTSDWTTDVNSVTDSMRSDIPVRSVRSRNDITTSWAPETSTAQNGTTTINTKTENNRFWELFNVSR